MNRRLRRPWPVRVACIGQAKVGTALWREASGRLNVTAIVKATFAFAQDAPVRIISPMPIRRRDEHVRKDPMRSLKGAAENAPVMPNVGVHLVGHAHAPPGGTERHAVRLVVRSGGSVRIDKSLLVYGDRKGEGRPATFERLELGFERALGGMGSADNPLGVRYDDEEGPPNIVDPNDPRGQCESIGPLPAIFPARRKLRGNIKPRTIERGIADYPGDFCWDYFQAVPKDQQLDRLRGDEWIELTGLHPNMQRIRTQLPSARALVRVYGSHEVGVPEQLELTADTVHIEPDEEWCSLVWRAHFSISSELAAQQLLIAGTVVAPGHHYGFPATAGELEHIASPMPDLETLDGALNEEMQRTAERDEERAALEAARAERLAYAMQAPVSPPSHAPQAAPSYQAAAYPAGSHPGYVQPSSSHAYPSSHPHDHAPVSDPYGALYTHPRYPHDAPRAGAYAPHQAPAAPSTHPGHAPHPAPSYAPHHHQAPPAAPTHPGYAQPSYPAPAPPYTGHPSHHAPAPPNPHPYPDYTHGTHPPPAAPYAHTPASGTPVAQNPYAQYAAQYGAPRSERAPAPAASTPAPNPYAHYAAQYGAPYAERAPPPHAPMSQRPAAWSPTAEDDVQELDDADLIDDEHVGGDVGDTIVPPAGDGDAG